MDQQSRFTNPVPLASPWEKAWLNTELCHRELLKAIPVAIYTCDAQGVITFFNEAAADLWGRNPVIGRDSWCGAWKLFRLDGSPVNLGECPMAIAIIEERGIRGEQVIIQRPDGSLRYVIPHPEPIVDDAGAVVGAVNTILDISDSEVGRLALQSFPRPSPTTGFTV